MCKYIIFEGLGLEAYINHRNRGSKMRKIYIKWISSNKRCRVLCFFLITNGRMRAILRCRMRLFSSIFRWNLQDNAPHWEHIPWNWKLIVEMKRATIYLYTVYDHMNFMNLVDCLSGLIGCWQCLLDQAYFQLLHKTVHRWKF